MKRENGGLTRANFELKRKISAISIKIENFETHSHRNDFRFNGIEGSQRDSWIESENKIKTFLKENLDMPELKDVEIKRAHQRENSGPTRSRNIMMKFLRYSDRERVLQKNEGGGGV